ncbi:MAG: sigma-70 family RNA polymerase sigma factor [Byssovorax sp.]
MSALHNREPPPALTHVDRDPLSAPALPRPLVGSGPPPRSAGRAPPAIEAAGEVTFDQTFAEYAPFVWRSLRRLGVREADVEDVCQEVFLVVHRRLADFEGRSSLRTWIYGICLRSAARYRRRPHRGREDIASTPPEQTVAPTQDDDLERRQALAQLDRALDELDDDKRAVFVLYELEELTMAQIAEAAGCPIQTAYSRLHAARRIVTAALSRVSAERSTPSCR